jgi:hypothetical protein
MSTKIDDHCGGVDALHHRRTASTVRDCDGYCVGRAVVERGRHELLAMRGHMRG